MSWLLWRPVILTCVACFTLSAGTPNCWTNTTVYGTDFKLCTDSVPRASAQGFCYDINMTLATNLDNQTFYYWKNYLKAKLPYNNIWVGATYSKNVSSFVWDTGGKVPLTYMSSSLSTTMYDGMCLLYYYVDQMLASLNCSENRGYLCQALDSNTSTSSLLLTPVATATPSSIFTPAGVSAASPTSLLSLSSTYTTTAVTATPVSPSSSYIPVSVQTSASTVSLTSTVTPIFATTPTSTVLLSSSYTQINITTPASTVPLSSAYTSLAATTQNTTTQTSTVTSSYTPAITFITEAPSAYTTNGAIAVDSTKSAPLATTILTESSMPTTHSTNDGSFTSTTITTLSENISISITSAAYDGDCLCGCHVIEVPLNKTERDALAAQETKKIKQTLLLPTENLSSFIRTKVSIMDYRPSAMCVGGVGIAFLVSTFLAIILMDLTNIIRWTHRLVKRLKRVTQHKS